MWRTKLKGENNLIFNNIDSNNVDSKSHSCANPITTEKNGI